MNREEQKPKVNKKKVSKSQTFESNTWDFVMRIYQYIFKLTDLYFVQSNQNARLLYKSYQTAVNFEYMSVANLYFT